MIFFFLDNLSESNNAFLIVSEVPVIGNETLSLKVPGGGGCEMKCHVAS